MRALAKLAANSDCKLAALGFAARVDFDTMLDQTPFEVPYGQSPFAFRRGLRFEASLRERGYAPVFDLLHAHLGHDVTAASAVNMREGFKSGYRGMKDRAKETAVRIRAIASRAPGAPNLIDGAVLTREVGGVRAYFEADAVAARFGGPLHVGEIKSFPTVDGRADPESVGAAISQVAIYILLLRDLVAYVGAKPDLVSMDALLITPRNTGLRPTLSIKAVGREVDRAERILTRAPSAVEIAGSLSDDLPGFGVVSDKAAPEAQRLEAAHQLAECVGTTYRPACLSACGLSRLCRARSHASGDPLRVGGTLARILPGISSLDRAFELAHGSMASPEERPAAEQLVRASRLRQKLIPRERPT